jgi:hypothetical protein
MLLFQTYDAPRPLNVTLVDRSVVTDDLDRGCPRPVRIFCDDQLDRAGESCVPYKGEMGAGAERCGRAVWSAPTFRVGRPATPARESGDGRGTDPETTPSARGSVAEPTWNGSAKLLT